MKVRKRLKKALISSCSHQDERAEAAGWLTMGLTASDQNTDTGQGTACFVALQFAIPKFGFRKLEASSFWPLAHYIIRRTIDLMLMLRGRERVWSHSPHILHYCQLKNQNCVAICKGACETTSYYCGTPHLKSIPQYKILIACLKKLSRTL